MQEALLAWFERRARPLPWRTTRDPYRIWVSEVMLQQTRVDVATPYYVRWMERFPDVESLASATEDEVTAAWAGLGYYGRARRLHSAAQQVAAEGMPLDRDGLLRLPGIGPYTAAAVASIAYGEPVAAIDGNVERVVARLHALRSPVDKAAGRQAVHAAAQALLATHAPGTWNEAMMELGATVCTPRPRCDECPVAEACEARRQGIAPDLPVRSERQPPKTEPIHMARIQSGGRLLLVKRPPGGLLAGTWCLPSSEDPEALTRAVADQTGAHVELTGRQSSARHVFSHRIWDITVHDAQVLEVDHAAPATPCRWVPLDAIDELGVSTAARRAIEAEPLKQRRVGGA